MKDTEIEFKEMAEEYLPSVTDLYNHYVLHTTATFHTRPLSLNEMRSLVFFDNPRFKAFVILRAGVVCGYAIAAPFKRREAYDETAEVTVYLQPEITGQGIGSRAVQFIEDYAGANGFHALLALICGENTQSVRVFERNGYEKCAHYKEIGKKFGRRLDVVAYQKIIL